jgi:hypothetical protein
VHNGTKAVCTFSFVNRGNAGKLTSHFTMPQMQFVDDAHVPHRSDARYFVDKYGTRQGQLFVNGGDNGIFVAEFANVDPHVASGEFHFQKQIVGGVSVAAPAAATAQGAAPVVSR